MRIYEDYDWSTSLLDEQLMPYQWTGILSSTYLKQLEMSPSDDEPTQSWSTFLDFVLSRLLFSCTVVTVQVTPQFEYEGTSWQPSVRLQKCFKLHVFCCLPSITEWSIVCIHLMMRDQWWWLGSSDSCEFCVGTDMIMAVSRRICSCIYSQRSIYADLCCYMLIYADICNCIYLQRRIYVDLCSQYRKHWCW